jgi:uncharacterized protein (DUF433 family)
MLEAGTRATLTSGTNYVVRYWRTLVRPALERVSICLYEIFRIELPHMGYLGIITMEPGKRSGKPCIRGLRITVYDILDSPANGMTHADNLREFPYLTEEDIRACLAFAADRERKLEILNA